MGGRPGHLRRSVTPLAAAALFAAGATLATLATLATSVAPTDDPYPSVLAGVLAVWAAALLLILADALDPTPDEPSAGVLDRLLATKRRGGLTPVGRPRPDSRTSPPAPPVVMGGPPGVLDRLTAVKRRRPIAARAPDRDPP